MCSQKWCNFDCSISLSNKAVSFHIVFFVFISQVNCTIVMSLGQKIDKTFSFAPDAKSHVSTLILSTWFPSSQSVLFISQESSSLKPADTGFNAVYTLFSTIDVKSLWTTPDTQRGLEVIGDYVTNTSQLPGDLHFNGTTGTSKSSELLTIP